MLSPVALNDDGDPYGRGHRVEKSAEKLAFRRSHFSSLYPLADFLLYLH